MRLAGTVVCKADEADSWPDSFFRVPDVDADGRDGEFARSDMLQNDKSFSVAHGWL